PVRRVLLAALLTPLLLLGSCALLLRLGLLPEGYAVNAPLRQMLLDRGVEAPPESAFGGRIRTAEGFGSALFAEGVPGARFLRPTPSGDLLLSQPRSGRVLLLEADRDGDGRTDGVHTLLEGLNRPHGLDLHEGWLYVGETDAVVRVRFDAAARRTRGAIERVVTGLPTGGNHWTRTLRVGEDGWLYVSVGSSCNVCIEEDPRRAALLRFRPDGSAGETFATGLRNAVGFDWQPGTGRLFATDNGRDLLGDDFPPCELNEVVASGFYGWPFANGHRVPDPDLGAGRELEIEASIPPVHGFGAHNAPLGIAFVRGDAPPGYQDAALVALHGSWNRSRKDGYKVVSLHWQPDGTLVERDFLWGFLEDEDVIGRPVDVAQGTDGAFYVSDDYAGAVYRVAWGAQPGDLPQPAARRPEAAAAAGLTAAEREERGSRGQALYQAHGCAGCHEAEGGLEGVVPRELTGLSQRYDPSSLAALLETPPPPMPVVPLSDEQRRDLAVYLLVTHP
ncbi:MAG: PQQ-dependent sugar dehydrogenase, partial [Myxococcota bacterium]